MASISVTVGPRTATETGNDAKMTSLGLLFLAATGGPVEGTAQEQVAWIAHQLRLHFIEVALGERRRQAFDEAAIAAEIGDKDF